MDEKIFKHLGGEGAMISASKSGYRKKHPKNLVVFNSNVCIGLKKVWWGDLDITLSKNKLISLSKELNDVISKYPEYDEILIEDKANGSAIIDTMRRKVRAVIPIEPYGSKEARASAISPMLEAGNVYIHHTHGSIIEEAVEFPNSENDDEVDAMTQALNRLRQVLAELPTVKDPDIIEYEDELDDAIGYM